MTTLRTTTDADGVMTVWLDVPDKGVNTVSPQVLHDLAWRWTRSCGTSRAA